MKIRINVAACLLAALVAITVFGGAGETEVATSRNAPKKLFTPKREPSFSFAVIGDRTGGQASGLAVLKQAVADINLIGPDFVMSVGDMIGYPGYMNNDGWLKQKDEFRAIVDRLEMPWYPCAGNHDIYWDKRDPNAPKDAQGRELHHDVNYEKHFGPLWYAFAYENSWFIVLNTDEGDPQTGKRHHATPATQTMSGEQKQWLSETLKKAARADHVFIFLHHPRWFPPAGKDIDYGDDWRKNVHPMLEAAGNVRAVFAGHIHKAHYNKIGRIEYFLLGPTGASLRKKSPATGYLHHFNLITVRKTGIRHAIIPVSSVQDPRKIEAEQISIREDDPRSARTCPSKKSFFQRTRFCHHSHSLTFESLAADACGAMRLDTRLTLRLSTTLKASF